MTSIKIRPAVPEDIPELLAFEQGVIFAERPYDARLKEDPILYYNLEALIQGPDSILMLAENEMGPIASGYADIRKSKPYYKNASFAYLGFMYVMPEYRGQQVIQLILDALKEWCRARSIHELRLQVYAENIPAIKAYQKAGFRNNMIEMICIV